MIKNCIIKFAKQIERVAKISTCPTHCCLIVEWFNNGQIGSENCIRTLINCQKASHSHVRIDSKTQYSHRFFRTFNCKWWHRVGSQLSSCLFAFCMIDIRKIIECTRFRYLNANIILDTINIHTRSLSERAICTCRLQQIAASSNLPSTLSVLPRFPLAFASPWRSANVLNNYLVSKVENPLIFLNLNFPHLASVRSCRWYSSAFA